MGTAQDAKRYVGRNATLTVEHLVIEVKVLDARYAFGRTDLLVEPKAGRGQQWVSLERVSLNRN